MIFVIEKLIYAKVQFLKSESSKNRLVQPVGQLLNDNIAKAGYHRQGNRFLILNLTKAV